MVERKPDFTSLVKIKRVHNVVLFEEREHVHRVIVQACSCANSRHMAEEQDEGKAEAAAEAATRSSRMSYRALIPPSGWPLVGGSVTCVIRRVFIHCLIVPNNGWLVRYS